jgi:hypothetical protein
VHFVFDEPNESIDPLLSARIDRGRIWINTRTFPAHRYCTAKELAIAAADIQYTPNTFAMRRKEQVATVIIEL